MSGARANIWLETCLAPIAPFLARSEVTDIWVNRPRELWLETLGGATERHDVPVLTEALLLRFARQIASLCAQGINREHPILSGTLPNGERVQVVIPPATRGSVAIAIRKHQISGLALEDYEAGGAFSATRMISAGELGKPVQDASGADTPMQILRAAVRKRRNILLSGGTSTGKTTFLNSLLREIPPHERLILIEDTPELKMSHDNAVGLLCARGVLGEAAVTAEDLLIASLRMRPDRIILGEIRGSEAATFLRAVNTGHPGSISTIHADTPERAIDQLSLLVLQTGIRMAWEDVVTYVKRSLNVIVQLERTADGRAVSHILTLAH